MWDARSAGGARTDTLKSQTARRVHFLDVLRGIAILGILPVNAGAFAYAAHLANDARYPGAPGDDIVAFVVHAFFETKFITIFSFLFGVGMGLLAERAERRSASYHVPMVRRLFALVCLGGLHGVLLWYGDVVTLYAVLGLATFWMARLPPVALFWIGIAGLLFSALPAIPMSLAHGSVALPDGVVDVDPAGSWGRFMSTLGGDDPDFEIAVYGVGTWGRITVLRGMQYLAMVFASVFFWGPRTAGLFLIGMAAVRCAWFRDPSSDTGRRTFTWMLLAGALIGLPCCVASALVGAPGAGTAALLASGALQYGGGVLLAAGYVAAVALLVSRAEDAPWTRPFAAVGRTAFTSYIAQSAIMTTIFYAYGGALFGKVDRTTLALIVVAVWLLQLAIAPLWLRVFHAGPLEWLWRSVTYWKLQPFLRRRAAEQQLG